MMVVTVKNRGKTCRVLGLLVMLVVVTSSACATGAAAISWGEPQEPVYEDPKPQYPWTQPPDETPPVIEYAVFVDETTKVNPTTIKTTTQYVKRHTISNPGFDRSVKIVATISDRELFSLGLDKSTVRIKFFSGSNMGSLDGHKGMIEEVSTQADFTYGIFTYTFTVPGKNIGWKRVSFQFFATDNAGNQASLGDYPNLIFYQTKGQKSPDEPSQTPIVPVKTTPGGSTGKMQDGRTAYWDRDGVKVARETYNWYVIDTQEGVLSEAYTIREGKREQTAAYNHYYALSCDNCKDYDWYDPVGHLAYSPVAWDRYWEIYNMGWTFYDDAGEVVEDGQFRTWHSLERVDPYED